MRSYLKWDSFTVTLLNHKESRINIRVHAVPLMKPQRKQVTQDISEVLCGIPTEGLQINGEERILWLHFSSTTAWKK
jgi:hypothetical protein